ncbi:putative bifunctional diguanylate cyclase/phosphodiesterase [Arsukibacterium sp.]|uniref:putative bifunctional diguanylate cyclase/phosphodiesterase n=1 Tax=Arsukibacterium sp. TaxID=1977258 RepID=UPI00299EA59B|nr:EAL domain-containing protein [Arsukibacterium sp.]MDX1536985.1 EAL domain-containing protein [Arsukibacterium sp.]
MFKSLRSKWISLLVVLLSLLMLLTGYATLKSMRANSMQQAEQSLDVASKVFQQALDARAAQLTNSVSLLAADFGFRQAIATAEQATIESVLQNHGSRIDAQLALLLSPQGELLASSDRLKASDIRQLLPETLGSNAVTDILLIDGRAYQLVVVPVRAPVLIAWVGMGFLVDEPLAEQIKGITGLDISFTQLNNRAGQQLTSTLPAQTQRQLLDQLDNIMAYPDTTHFADEFSFITRGKPLDSEKQLWALLHMPDDRWLASYQQLRGQLVEIFAFGLLLALIAAFMFARSISKPLSLLSSFARDIGQGNAAVPPPVSQDEIGVLTSTLVNMQHSIAARELQLRQQAEHDALTGLLNRHAVEQRLPAILAAQPGTLLQLNIIQFKHINDTLGLANGDTLLQLLAQRLGHHQPAAAFCARLNGDEFLMLFNENLTEQQLVDLYNSLQPAYNIQNSLINLKIAIGIYPFEPAQVSASEALRRVDLAQENASQAGGGIAFYQHGQDETHQRELTIIRDLPAALSSGQLYVVYQPKVELASGQCHSAEALIRWQHPQLGFISPVEFIATAEHSGNISMITQWMLQTVIKQLAAWQQDYPTLRVAVNLSAADLLDQSLPVQIGNLLAQYQVPATALALEVTESAVMQDTSKVIANLNTLKAMAINLAIDDFGTGQSSLAYLKQLPVNEIKIDRAFVKDIETNSNDALIVNATVKLAHGLGFKVTAEGLENQAGLSYLQESGCDTVQGYFFSKPLATADFSQWLTNFAATANNPAAEFSE